MKLWLKCFLIRKRLKTRSGDNVMLKDLLEEGLERSMAKLIEKGRDKVRWFLPNSDNKVTKDMTGSYSRGVAEGPGSISLRLYQICRPHAS